MTERNAVIAVFSDHRSRPVPGGAARVLDIRRPPVGSPMLYVSLVVIGTVVFCGIRARLRQIAAYLQFVECPSSTHTKEQDVSTYGHEALYHYGKRSFLGRRVAAMLRAARRFEVTVSGIVIPLRASAIACPVPTLWREART